MKRIFYCFIVISLLVPVVAGTAEANPGLIAVASDEKTQPANVSSQAARCEYYIIFNAMKGKGIMFYELKGKADDAVKEVLKLK